MTSGGDEIQVAAYAGLRGMDVTEIVRAIDDPKLFVAGGEPASVPVSVDFNSRYDLEKNAGTLEPSVLKIGSAAAHLTGTYQIPDQTIVRIKVEGQNMPASDLQAFLPAIGIHMPSSSLKNSVPLQL